MFVWWNSTNICFDKSQIYYVILDDQQLVLNMLLWAAYYIHQK